MSSGSDLRELRRLAAKLADERQADILIFNGPIGRSTELNLLGGRPGRSGRRSVLLILGTLGGSADVAYRVARALRRSYETFTMYVDDYCKGAGTLVALAADELVMSDFGELGPLDLRSSDAVELGQKSSGLTALQTLSALRSQALGTFESYFLRLRVGSRLPLTTRLAAEQASAMAVGLFSPIFAQLDPAELSEIERTIQTAMRYGENLGGGNLREGALARLVSEYPSHDFVVDRDEARTLFHRVREPTADEAELLKYVEPIAGDRGNEAQLMYLDDVLRVVAEPERPVSGAGDARAVGGTARPEDGADNGSDTSEAAT